MGCLDVADGHGARCGAVAADPGRRGFAGWAGRCRTSQVLPGLAGLSRRFTRATVPTGGAG